MVMSKEDKTKYKNKFNKENYARIGLYVDPEQKEAIQAHAASHGESVNKFINRAIMETIERDIADLEEPASVSQAEYWQLVKRIIDRNRAEREERKRNGKTD